MNTKWCAASWLRCEDIYRNILEHPFIRELMAGTLPEEKFLFYIFQDAYYLGEYGKALAVLAGKLNRGGDISSFLGFAADTIAVEKALHESFLGKAPAGKLVEESPSTVLYTSYISAKVALENVEVGVAAVLPCFWVYKKVGDYILAHQSNSLNPYQQWIDTYGGEEYAAAVDKSLEICDRLADEVSEKSRQNMFKVFRRGIQMEWLFWDSAYRMEKWPV